MLVTLEPGKQRRSEVGLRLESLFGVGGRADHIAQGCGSEPAVHFTHCGSLKEIPEPNPRIC